MAKPESMLLLLDNHDSFTYNLADYLAQLGHAPVVKRPEEMTWADWQAGYDGVVLSPGPGHPAQVWPYQRIAGSNKVADCQVPNTELESSIPSNLVETVGHFAGRGIPILGICLGHQAIGLWAGASLASQTEPVHGKIFRLWSIQRGLFEGLPQGFNVVRYHSLALAADSLPSCLNLDATCTSRHQGAEGQLVVMAVSHKTLPIWGLQYHPEAALTEYGMVVIARWLKFCGLAPSIPMAKIPVSPTIKL